jgi:alkylhydroperoxidase family enzyme
MSFDRKTSLPKAWDISIEMMERQDCRIPLIEPEHVPEDLVMELKPLYQFTQQKTGSVPRFVQMLGHSPAFVEAWGLIESRVRFAYLQIDPDFMRTLQLVIIKTAILMHSNNCTAHNVDLGLEIGLSWDQMDALEGDDWKKSDLFTPAQKAAIAWAEAVTRQTAYDNDAVFMDLARHFETRKIVELTFYCGMWNLSGRLTEPFHQIVEPPGRRISFRSIGDDNEMNT